MCGFIGTFKSQTSCSSTVVSTRNYRCGMNKQAFMIMIPCKKKPIVLMTIRIYRYVYPTVDDRLAYNVSYVLKIKSKCVHRQKYIDVKTSFGSSRSGVSRVVS